MQIILLLQAEIVRLRQELWQMEVEYQMSQAGVEPNRKEGYNGSNWVILDYGDIVVHIFYKETRDYYQLERLWADGEKIDIEEYVIEE